MSTIIVCDPTGDMLFVGKSALKHETRRSESGAAPAERTVRESGFFQRVVVRSPFLQEWERLNGEEPTLVCPRWSHG
jgi:hypothetical protein